MRRESNEHPETDVGPNLKADLSKTQVSMRKFIFIINAIELLQLLMSGKYVQGVLYIDKNTGLLTFRAYNRKPRNQVSDKLIHQLEMGWVKESAEKYKLFISVYKKLGLARILSILDRETKEAKNALFDKELIDSI